MHSVYSTLTEAFLRPRNDRPVVTFLEGPGARTANDYNHDRLRQECGLLLGTLQAQGLRKGDHAIIYGRDPRDFVVSFWACQLGGIVPAPVSAGRTDFHRERLTSIWQALDRCHVITDADHHDWVAGVLNDHGAQGRLSVTTMTGSRPGQPVAVEADDTALLQFSSGSTGAAKGVVLTHRNLLANIAAIGRGIELSGSDSITSWLPLSHDMGLIGFHLTPLVWGVSHALLAPPTFFRNPLSWLRATSARNATITCSPNFGIRHTLRHLARARDLELDLSCVRVLFNGAEPISADLCREFARALAPAGFRRTAMFPVYGLAEASLAVSFPQLGSELITMSIDATCAGVGDRVTRLPSDSPKAMELVAVGKPIASVEVSIFDDEGNDLPEATVGRVFIRGPSVSGRYHPECDHVRLGEWLDTGDIGLFLDGELYIAGRAKEIFVHNGVKYHLSDLERTLEGLECLRGVPFSLGCIPSANRQETLAIFIEDPARRVDHESLLPALRRALFAKASLELRHSISIAKLPRTSSGKVRRAMLSQARGP